MTNIYGYIKRSFKEEEYYINKLKKQYSDYYIESIRDDIPLGEALEKISSYDMFFNNRLFIFRYEDSILKGSKDFQKYLEYPNKNNILLLILDKKINNKNIEYLDNLKDYELIDLFLEDYTISYNDKKYLLYYCSNIDMILQGIELLKIYKSNDKHISREDIENIIIN